jgi:copper chaperone
MADAIIFLVIIIICIFGIKSLTWRMANGCCGGVTAEKPVKVRDRNKVHYQYCAEMKIGGMKCRNCVLRVQNALNSLDGVWARVNLEKGTALIRTRSKINDERLAAPVCAVGYSVKGIRWQK